jgi:hypothetical protein
VLRPVVVCLLALGLASRATAQKGRAVEGGTEFILPVGARAMALGQAIVASPLGAEGAWWNPALIARSSNEVLAGSVNGVAQESDLSAVFVYTLPRVISVAISARYVNNGAGQASTDPNTPSGGYVQSVYVLGATFAAPFGNRLAIGTTLKLLAVGFDCTGTCPNKPQNTPVTGAVDLGVQYSLRRDSVIVVGAAIRSLGLPLFFNDSPQADPLLGRIDLGIEFAPKLKQYPGAAVRLSAAVVERVFSRAGPGFRAGAEASWLDQYFGRVGYVKDGPTGSGPSIGGGASLGKWRVDFAQFLSDFSAGTGTRPTYFSLQYTF